MSSRRTTRAARSTRTTRRTVERQQLLLGVSNGAGTSSQVGSTSGVGGVGFSAGGGERSSGGGSAGGYLYHGSSKRRLSRSKPTRKWIQIQRPPALGVGFCVTVWVPVDQLTDTERSLYLPPSENDESIAKDGISESPLVASTQTLPTDSSASVLGDEMVVEASVHSIAATSEYLDGSPTADAEASAASSEPSDAVVGDITEVNPSDTAAATRIDDFGGGEADQTNPLEDLQSPNERPRKRARFDMGENQQATPTVAEEDSQPRDSSSTSTTLLPDTVPINDTSQPTIVESAVAHDAAFISEQSQSVSLSTANVAENTGHDDDSMMSRDNVKRTRHEIEPESRLSPTANDFDDDSARPVKRSRLTLEETMNETAEPEETVDPSVDMPAKVASSVAEDTTTEETALGEESTEAASSDKF